MQLLCAFVRNPTPDNSMANTSSDALCDHMPPLRDDVQAAVTAIGTRSEIGRLLEWDNVVNLDLNGADLVRADMRKLILRRADLRRTHLTHANLANADLRRADLTNADLSNAELSGAICEGAVMENTSLKGSVAQWTNFVSANLTGSNLSDGDFVGSDFSEARCFDVSWDRSDISGADFRRQNESGKSNDFVATSFYPGPTSQQLEQARWNCEDPPQRSAFIVG